MKKKSFWIILVALLLVAALTVALVLLLGGEKSEPIDSDGDGRPDDVDDEPEDSLENDNRVDIDDFFP